MFNPRIHSRTKFKIKLASHSDKTSVFQVAVRQAGGWLKQHSYSAEDSDSIFKAWLYRGGDWKSQDKRVTVKTLNYQSDLEIPEYWALRLEHQDELYSQRNWRTDIIMKSVNKETAEIIVTVKWSLKPGFFGEEPELPQVSAPRIVKYLVENEDFECYSGNKQISAKATKLVSGDGREFMSYLKSESRRIPVILINTEGEIPELNPDNLQRLSLGSCIVYWYNEVSLHQELDFEWGSKKNLYNCRKNSMRIYRSGLNTDSTNDNKRHRFFAFDWYGDSVEKLERAIIASINRTTALNIRSGEVVDLESLRSLQNRFRISQLKNSKELEEVENETKDYINALEEENTDLTKERDDLLSRLEIEEDRTVELELKLEEVESQKLSAENQFNLVGKSMQKLAELEQIVSEYRLIFDRLPTSIEEVLKTTEGLYRDNIIVLNKAFESSKNAKFDQIEDAWNLLRAMATTLHELHFKEGSVNVEAEFKNRSGFELTLKEGSSTRSNPRLMKLRERMYNGEIISCEPHVKCTRNSKVLRVHYYADNHSEKIVIGHCGNHLPTEGSSRRKES